MDFHTFLLSFLLVIISNIFAIVHLLVLLFLFLLFCMLFVHCSVSFFCFCFNSYTSPFALFFWPRNCVTLSLNLLCCSNLHVTLLLLVFCWNSLLLRSPCEYLLFEKKNVGKNSCEIITKKKWMSLSMEIDEVYRNDKHNTSVFCVRCERACVVCPMFNL